MIDFSASMQRTYEFFLVDAATWCDAKKLACIDAASTTYDSSTDTGCCATFDSSEVFGEAYIRVYAVCRQGGNERRDQLGTFLCQTGGGDHNGRRFESALEAYSPLLELADYGPDIGFFVPAGEDAVSWARRLAMSHARAPVSLGGGVSHVLSEPYVAEPGESWLKFVNGLLSKAGMRLFVDFNGHITSIVDRDAESMAPVAFISDDGPLAATKIQSDVSHEHDLYGVPNTYVAVLSRGDKNITAIATNADPLSPTSTVSRGRPVYFYDLNPDIENPDGDGALGRLQAYSQSKLKEKSVVTHRVRYRRPWQPNIRVGDCVRLDLNRSGIHARAIVVKQETSCTPGGQVHEESVYKEAMM